MRPGQAETKSRLYTPLLLSLSAELANYPLKDGLTHHAETRSRTCGSSIELGLALDAAGAVTSVGMQVTACAVGQSSAAIFARNAEGETAAQLADIRAAIIAWLEANGPMPDWPGFEALAPAQAHPGRHGALLLVWNAACEALSSPVSSG